ncbi:MAG: D-alanine--D-alanine ligase [Alphaproteobacteria bacterium]
MAEHIAVLKGGWSAEREVSLVSGGACAAALRTEGFEVREIDVVRDIPSLIAELKDRPRAVFNALHGPYGEDGCVQGLLNMMDIPYTHSGVLASALAMDKAVARSLFTGAGLPVAEGRVVTLAEVQAGDVMERPYVLKPIKEGSSFGVRIVRAGDNEPAAAGFEGYRELLAERFIEGRELTVAVMGEQALAVTELRPHRGFYDYEAKYTEGRTEHICPADLPGEVTEALMEMALSAHELLGCRGVSRADFRYDETVGGRAGIYLLEVNTQPGMTPLSLAPEQAALRGIPFGGLVRWMVEHAACD